MRKILIIIFVLAALVKASAQDVQFTAQAKSAVAVGEQFRLTFNINAKGSGFRQPDLSNFDVLMGPSTSSSSNIQIINGQMTQNFSYAYTYILQATKEGKFTIGAAEITVNGKVFKSNTLSIEVVKGSNSGNGTKTNDNSTTGNISNEDLFVRVNVSRSAVYQGEHIIATLKIYTRLNLAGFENMKIPSFQGFWSEDIETPKQISLQTENINGTVYNVGIIKKVILYPQKNGELIIEPAEFECLVQQKVRHQRSSFFDDFFGSYQNVKKTIKSPAVKISVKPLPPNKPSSFNNAVGDFKLIANLDKNNVKTNDALTLKISISGSGNLKLVDAPKIEFPPDFEVYDPKITENISHTAGGSNGTKSVEYLIIPRHAGNYKIAPVAFSYFNPETRQYKTLSSGEFNITVEKGSGDENTTVVSGFTKEDVKFIGSDIRFIKSGKQSLKQKGKFLFSSPFFICGYIGTLILFLAFFIVRRKQIRQNANIALVRTRKANKIAKRHLKTAEVHLKQNNREKFFEELLKGLSGYLSNKLTIPIAELNKETIAAILKNRSITEQLIEQTIHLLDTCEFARYAPASEVSEMNHIYNDATQLIGNFERELK